MHNNVFGALYGLERLPYQMFARLHQHLNGNIVRYEIIVYKPAANFILGFARRREAYLDFLEAYVAKGLEKL